MESIQKFYSGKTILITGGTGFMGKVLIEKLLRSCPDISSIFILVRSKRNKSAQQRWDELTKLELFDTLKKEFPKNLEKVKVLGGQISLPGFGLDNDTYEEIKKKVSIIFHVAANVRFDEPLNMAYEANVASTMNIINFALEAQKIDVFLHVSSTYSNTHEKCIKEEVYPPLQDWREVGKIVMDTNPSFLNILNQKYLSPSINTYIFTKHLAEQVVNEYKDKLPTVIVRPSVVTPSYQEPMKGWVDNLNGPLTSAVLSSKGILRCILATKSTKLDCVPVDVSVKSFIVAAWKKGVEKSNDKKFNLAVYNSSSVKNRLNYTQMIDEMMEHTKTKPIGKVIWQPSCLTVENENVFLIFSFFLHFIPSLIVDLFLKISGQEPRLFKIQKKTQNAFIGYLKPFASKDWEFENTNFRNLLKEIPPESKESFDYSFENSDLFAYVRDSCDGIGKYVLRETENKESTLKHNRRMYILDILAKSLISIGTAYAAFVYCV